jgi:hypothetical protein
MDSIERRRDPRTDPSHSLVNLLRTRAERLACALAALGTEDGLVMASSHPGPSAEEVVARASAGLVGERVISRRVEVDGRAVLLTLLSPATQDEHELDDLALRVRAILAERRARAAA